ncbi:MAG: tRNA (N(6)-L-threonylcarbamoyladenosine(37)-C(2))-methylthiotransferase MtaB [Candidatus Acidiferrum sp.]
MSTFYIEQFGCRATQADGAAIERQLRERGCVAAREAGLADVVVVNTCTVTSAADAQARDAIRKIHAANPTTKIIVTGCYAQRAPGEIAALPGVTHVVGNSHKAEIPRLLTTISAALPIIQGEETAPYHSAPILSGDIFAHSEVLVAPVLGGEGNHTRPTLKIQDGCNSRCSFCVIPFVRGRSRSLPVATVMSETQRLSDSGFREIVLSGINLGTYGRDLTPRVEFLELLQRILRETSVERLRISSIEPMDVTQDLIELFAATDRIAPHFHMPLQSASNRILAAMHRWYRAEHYARRLELVRERLPHAGIGADLISGFPGETDGDHAATMRFVEERSFTYLHVFSYSARPGTRGASLGGQLCGDVIKGRARELRALGERKAAEFRESQMGQTLRVLTLHRSAKDDRRYTPALSGNYLSVMIPQILPHNQWLTVSLTGPSGKQILAQPVESSLVHVGGTV